MDINELEIVKIDETLGEDDAVYVVDESSTDADKASLEPLPGAGLGACAERSVGACTECSVGAPAGVPVSVPQADATESRLIQM